MKKNILSFSLLILSLTGFSQSFQVGMQAPEIRQLTPDSVELKLSSLRGQMVLIEFWASWCAPCRRENPILVKTYSKYKDATFKNGQGFEIFSVSMDMKYSSWTEAIQKDSLYWPYHVSDLKGWRNEAAKLYGISQVPYSLLIDGNGTIVSVNPRGEKLETALRKLKK